MKRAIVFPGQGSQVVGMGKELAAEYPAARAVFDEVDAALGHKLSPTMFEGPEEILTLTENAQPAIMASSIALLRVLQQEKGFIPENYAAYFAGHSLGEYTALAAAGTFTLADTARLLRLRGQAMQKAVSPGEGSMAAILGLEFDQVKEVVTEASQTGICVIANDNSPGQIVVSGALPAVNKAIEIAKAKGAKRGVLLPVSAPFHSPFMQPAAAEMAKALQAVAMKAPTLPIIANVTARPVSDVEEIRALLVDQVSGMVRWRESVMAMAGLGVNSILEIGVGKVLAGLVKRIDSNITASCVSSVQDIKAFSA